MSPRLQCLSDDPIFFPAVGAKEEVNGLVAKFCLLSEEIVDHFADRGIPVREVHAFFCSVLLGDKFADVLGQ